MVSASVGLSGKEEENLTRHQIDGDGTKDVADALTLMTERTKMRCSTYHKEKYYISALTVNPYDSSHACLRLLLQIFIKV